jgi:hypothetical protein
MNVNSQDQIGALIVFKSHVEYERVMRWVQALREKDVVENATVQNFDPNHGYPVFYIP